MCDENCRKKITRLIVIIRGWILGLLQISKNYTSLLGMVFYEQNWGEANIISGRCDWFIQAKRVFTMENSFSGMRFTVKYVSSLRIIRQSRLTRVGGFCYPYVWAVLLRPKNLWIIYEHSSGKDLLVMLPIAKNDWNALSIMELVINLRVGSNFK